MGGREAMESLDGCLQSSNECGRCRGRAGLGGCVVVWDANRGVRRGKGELGGGTMVHFERRERTKSGVRDAVVSETDTLSKARPVKIIRGRQKFHCAIPESPPGLDLTVALWIVSAGGGATGASDGSDGCQQLG